MIAVDSIVWVPGETIYSNNLDFYAQCFSKINNNSKVYTPLSGRCSQSRVFVSQSHMNHIGNTVRII